LANVAVAMNPAEEASKRALAAVFASLEHGESFVLEAGAGAGKTYSLVKALLFLIKRDQIKLQKRHQKIACITFTNVAKDEIEARTDRNPVILCDTIHAFCWSLISGFQRQLRDSLPHLDHWTERIEEAGGLDERVVEYTLGYRGIKDHVVSIHHDDVLLLTIALMENVKFRRIISDKYPVILLDEYQDADIAWINSIKAHFLGQAGSPQFGFFGDHWQKIYGDGCGKIDSPFLTVIGKEANFRSVSTIVDCLNRMRPELPQFVVDPNETGSVEIFHTNKWLGTRQTGQHWGGDLPAEVSHAALTSVMDRLKQRGWDLSSARTKILMLTHRVLASEQGYSSLAGIFRFNQAFTKKEHGHIAFFVDNLEPACHAFIAKQYGTMFTALGGKLPAIRSQADKAKWSAAMDKLINLRANDTVGKIISHLRETRRPRLPDSVEERERELERFDSGLGEEMPAALTELEALHTVPYQEIVALTHYLHGHSPFETKHGVKGAEFENVIVVVGRGWNQYNFNEMLELAQDAGRIPPKKQEAFERNRNLFYVACSRPKRRLALLFTQKLSDTAMQTVHAWFGAEAVEALAI
jgi:DNA helicase II / ATP-dependent DNA helicase PcrA